MNLNQRNVLQNWATEVTFHRFNADSNPNLAMKENCSNFLAILIMVKQLQMLRNILILVFSGRLERVEKLMIGNSEN